MASRLRVTFALVALGAAAPAAWQQSTFRASVELVRVDAVVTDRDGHPIEGLKAEHFTVYDRRKPQAVATFQEIRHPRASAVARPIFPATLRLDVGSNFTAATDRFVVMLLDDLHIYKGRTDVVKDIARRVVNDLGPAASMAVVFTSGNHSTEVTEDRSVLLAAVETFQGRRGVKRPISGSDDRGGMLLAVPDAGPMGSRVSSTNPADFDANMSLFASLQSAARALGSNDTRRKAFVLISEGMAKDLSGLFETPNMAVPMQSGGTYSPADLTAATAAQPARFHDMAVVDLMDALRRSNVATYAIDPRGKVSPQDMLAECIPTQSTPDPCVGNGSNFSGWVRVAQRGLTELAQASGGFAVVDTNDFTAGLDRVVDDLDHYYMLGFYPSDPMGKDYRPLAVTVNVPGAVVRFRRGYVMADPAAPAAKKVDPVVALATGILPNPDLPLRVFATSLPGEGKTARVPVSLEVTVPRQGLEETNANIQDTVRYSILVVDLKGQKVKEQDGQTAKMGLQPRDPGLPPPDRVTYQIDLTLALSPGRYQLRASALSTKLEKGGSVYLSLDVPDYTNGPLSVSGLSIGYSTGARVPVFSGTPVRAGRSTARGRGGAPSSAFGGVQTAATLDREFAPTDELWLSFEIARHRPPKDVSIRLSVIDEHDRDVRYVESRMAAAYTGPGRLRVPLVNLPAGPYRLRVTAKDDKNTAQQEIGIVVR
jgi:VWFA-related protein